MWKPRGVNIDRERVAALVAEGLDAHRIADVLGYHPRSVFAAIRRLGLCRPCVACGTPFRAGRQGQVYCRPECRPEFRFRRRPKPMGRPSRPAREREAATKRAAVAVAAGLRADGWKLREIAEEFGVSEACVHQWLKRPKG